MSVRTPLVLINGKITTLPAADSLPATAVNGVRNIINAGEILDVQANYQFHVHGRLVLNSDAIYRVAGAGVVV